MCLIALAIDQHPKFSFVFAANRDEFYERPASPMHQWDTEPPMLAGRDLRAGGTWFSISLTGKIAAVTNVREPGRYDPEARTRGDIPKNFVLGDVDGHSYVRELQQNGEQYNGFNVLAGTVGSLWHASNRNDAGPTLLDSGIYTLSNAFLETKWPKTERAARELKKLLQKESIRSDDVFELLYDRTRAEPDELPDTGLPQDRERAVSSIFIQTPKYGTRCSTIILAEHTGHVLVMERTFNERADTTEERRFEFEIRNT